ncbi:MAG TPA: FxsA family protein [Alphaproteobacteria bacterium]|nr:FxsA family protein [Alphaproteobacteria bacterium]
MAPLILLAFLTLPFIEIAVFIRVGAAIGVLPTVALTLLSTAAGIALMRHQGLATLARARASAERNEPPVDEMLDGLCILLAGLLLIVPGFVTDALGLLLFIPAVRRRVRMRLWRGLEGRGGGRGPGGGGTVIETDYVVIKEDRKPGDAPHGPPRLGNGGA